VQRGMKHTKASKAKMRLAKLGKPGPTKGRKASAETKAKMSATAKARWAAYRAERGAPNAPGVSE